MAEPQTGARAKIRAALLALHVFAVSALAFPAPQGAMNRSAWKDPTVKAEFHAWAEVLRGAGLEVSDEAFEDRVWRIAKGFTDARDTVLAPFRLYYACCGTRQSWHMFVAPHRYPTRLHVEVREQGAWRPVYVERDLAHAWMAHWLDHYRFRSEIFRFGWTQYASSYAQFGRWLAHHAARDFPAADGLRTRFFRVESPTPRQVVSGSDPEGGFEYTRTYALDRE